MWYDILTVAILGFSTLRGAMKGIVWQLAVIVAIILCFAFAEPLSLTVSPYIAVDPPLNRWLAMLCFYLVFSFVSFMVARQLRDWIEKAKFVEYDRHIGALFGFCKGAIICLVLTFFVVTLSEDARGQILRTFSGHAAAVIMDRLHPVMPVELHEVLAPYIHQLDQPDLDLRHVHDDSGVTTAARAGDQDRQTRNRQGDTSRPQAAHDADADQHSDREHSVGRLVDSVSGVFDEGLRVLVNRAVQNTSEEDYAELIRQLSSGVPGLARRVAIEWQDGKPFTAPARPDSERTRLVDEIAAVLADIPDTRNAIVEEIESALYGVPDQAVMGLLQDWHSDLLAADPDPDSDIDMTTPLDTRILRQLAKSRIPIKRLSSRLQNRLRESLLR